MTDEEMGREWVRRLDAGDFGFYSDNVFRHQEGDRVVYAWCDLYPPLREGEEEEEDEEGEPIERTPMIYVRVSDRIGPTRDRAIAESYLSPKMLRDRPEMAVQVAMQCAQTEFDWLVANEPPPTGKCP